MTVRENIEELVAAAGLLLEDVAEIVIGPTEITYLVWAKTETGGIATVDSSLGDLPLLFKVKALWKSDHEHGPETHTHD